MIIENEYTINNILQLVDLNQTFINFKATFDIKADNKDNKFMISIVDEEQLEDESKIEFNSVIGHIDGEIDNTNDKYKNFYIALKSLNETKVNVKIDIKEIKEEIEENNINDLNTYSLNKNNTMNEEIPQRTSVNDIFDDEQEFNMEQPIQTQIPQQTQQEPIQTQSIPQQPIQQPIQQELIQQEPIQEDSDEETILEKIIKHKYYILAIVVVFIAYYLYTNPEFSNKLISLFSNSNQTINIPKSFPAPPDVSELIKTPIDMFTEQLEKLQV